MFQSSCNDYIPHHIRLLRRTVLMAEIIVCAK
ncbi:hypothetical protein T06_4485 [Trichinella sp. T6]|nr:hypothetical protein T06_4485 [Trichinella sp. T6]